MRRAGRTPGAGGHEGCRPRPCTRMPCGGRSGQVQACWQPWVSRGTWQPRSRAGGGGMPTSSPARNATPATHTGTWMDRHDRCAVVAQVHLCLGSYGARSTCGCPPAPPPPTALLPCGASPAAAAPRLPRSSCKGGGEAAGPHAAAAAAAGRRAGVRTAQCRAARCGRVRCTGHGQPASQLAGKQASKQGQATAAAAGWHGAGQGRAGQAAASRLHASSSTHRGHAPGRLIHMRPRCPAQGGADVLVSLKAHHQLHSATSLTGALLAARAVTPLPQCITWA